MDPGSDPNTLYIPLVLLELAPLTASRFLGRKRVGSSRWCGRPQRSCLENRNSLPRAGLVSGVAVLQAGTEKLVSACVCLEYCTGCWRVVPGAPVNVCMYVCMCACVLCECVYVHVCVCACVCVCVYVLVCMCVCVCVFIYRQSLTM